MSSKPPTVKLSRDHRYKDEYQSADPYERTHGNSFAKFIPERSGEGRPESRERETHRGEEEGEVKRANRVT